MITFLIGSKCQIKIGYNVGAKINANEGGMYLISGIMHLIKHFQILVSQFIRPCSCVGGWWHLLIICLYSSGRV